MLSRIVLVSLFAVSATSCEFFNKKADEPATEEVVPSDDSLIEPGAVETPEAGLGEMIEESSELPVEGEKAEGEKAEGEKAEGEVDCADPANADKAECQESK